MKMKSKLLLSLFVAVAARAANYVGDQTFAAPFELNENVNVVGNLTLSAPGTYVATSWNVVGFIRLASPGVYTVIATTGGFAVSGNAVGPVSGNATVRVNYRTAVNFVGTISNNVTVVDDSQTPPPATGGGEVVAPPVPAPLMNLSTRAMLTAGGVLNPGFVVGGTGARRVLVRAIGPGLAQFGVSGVMANPVVTVFRGAQEVGGNDDWGGSTTLQATFAAVGAFGLPIGSRDAAVVLTLPPGAYTATVRAVGAVESGEVLLEVYLLE
jgi:hypothetical protein